MSDKATPPEKPTTPRRQHVLPLTLSIRTPGRTFEASDGLYHPECSLLYVSDTITSLDECPFPLDTDSFKVLLFGREQPRANTGFSRWTVVEYRKGCGHIVQEKIRFEEGVKDFQHYGTQFTGASYSINDWKNRIEYFRKGRCEVCAMIEHYLWLYLTGEGGSRKSTTERAKLVLNYNYENWQEFVSFEKFEKDLKDVRAMVRRWK